MELQKIIQFAKENGYETVKKLKEWNGYKCYEPIEDENEISYVGPPLLIFVKDDAIRMSTVEEAFEQINSI